MSNSYHSHGKWAVGKKVPTAVYAGNDSPVCICDSMGETLSGTDAANARRIVACVNAFDGLPIELIDSMPGPVSEMALHALAVTEQCDQLLAALELAKSHIGWCWDHLEHMSAMKREGSAAVHDQIDAAIAAAKAGAQ